MTVEDKISKRPTPLLYMYSPEDIRARELAIEGLTEYTAGLLMLASSDASQRAGATAGAIAERLAQTADLLSELDKESKQKTGAFQFAPLSKPLSSLAKIAAEKWVSHVQREYIRQLIRDGYNDAEKTFAALENDVTGVLEHAYSDNAKINLLREDYYNQAANKMRFAGNTAPVVGSQEYAQYSAMVVDKGRLEFLREMQDSAKKLADLENVNPLSLIKNMRAVHSRLRKYADGIDSTIPVEEQVAGDVQQMQAHFRKLELALGGQRNAK